MGISVNGLRFLLHAKSSGVDFAKTATIGRQRLHLSIDDLGRVMNDEFGCRLSSTQLAELHESGYAEDLLGYLGADSVDSYDYSDYEGATHVHDFNAEIASERHRSYTAVVESGTLEHVFDLPVAIGNCMRMLEVGGHYVGMSPANNYMGHGFYQFSPELFFRVFSSENGFEIVHVVFQEGRTGERWYRVPDPAVVARRVGVKNSVPALLMVLATRRADEPIFASPPMQADYVARYGSSEQERAPGGRGRRLSSVVGRLLPASARERVKAVVGNHRFSDLLEDFDWRPGTRG